MKTLISLVAAGGVCVAGTYYVVQQRQAAATARLQAAHEQRLRALQEATDKLEAELEMARRNASGAVETLTAAPAVDTTSQRSPAEILRELRGSNPASGAKGRETRNRIIHHFESLVDAGPAAVPAIRDFLKRMEDVDYGASETREEGNAPGRGGGPPFNRGRRGASLDFDFPPTLRLGLVDVLRRIGGAEAEQALVEMLETTGRGVEVAYVARALDSMAEGKYRATAIAAAHELLTNPPVIEKPNRLDENSRTYLLNLLASYGDTSFASQAQQMLVGADGRIDRTVLNYLTTTLKDQAMSAVYQAYSDPRITNQWEKSSLVGTSLNYVGVNAQANQMLADVLANNSVGTPLKAMAIASLAGAERGPLRVEAPTDVRTIDARINLLESYRPSFEDERLLQVMDGTIQNLNNLREGKPVEDSMQNLRGLFRGEGGPGGGMGGRAGRGGAGGP